ncbi:MAG: radical SAM protein, partial [Deltaproteobacteria bacterium]|nr:radical SAM protein [Deltaproteobacteria bacterium]
NEPTVSAELIASVAPRANEAGLRAILVSNAYASRECMAVLRPMIQAANFDLKSFSDAFYRDVCGARLTPVLRTLEAARSFGWWLEITTLLIPGRNDSDEELAAIAGFIRKELGADVPWHISRFRPMFRLTDAPPTSAASLERARSIGFAEGLSFVYIGNVPGHDGENTYCPGCGKAAVRRVGYRTEAPAPPASPGCPHCGLVLPGVWT